MHAVKANLIIAAALAGLSHGALAAEAVPKPTPRPDLATAAALPKPKLRPAGDAPGVTPAVPVPRPRPLEATEPQSPPAQAPVDGPKGPGGWPAEAVSAGRAQCKALLAGLDITYSEIDPIGDEGGCGAPAPVAVSAVAGVRLVPPATTTCSMAAALVAWVRDEVQPAARRRLGTEVTEIRTDTSYACRRRNNGASGKMSEHSKANALDMSGFVFAKKTDLSVGGEASWGEGLPGAAGRSKDGSFLDDIRKAACAHFTTVLGPGSDPYHGDHFHVDVLARKGGYRICQ